jgi:hypothetical protein
VGREHALRRGVAVVVVVSRAEGVRRAIHSFVAQSRASEAGDEAFGLWAKAGDSVDYQNSLRDEW